MIVSAKTIANREKCRRYYARHHAEQKKRVLANYYKFRADPKKSKRITAINRKAKARQRFGVESREEILKRFNNECANCGAKKHLRIHHIDNEGRKAESQGRKANNDLKNLMVVCQGCHMSHHRYGLVLKMKVKSDTPSNGRLQRT